jgi:hypothetical protein
VLDTHEVSWDFGDGTVLGYRPAAGDALHPSHAYAATGTFTVTMRVRDDDGGVGVFQFRVDVAAVGLQPAPCDPSAGSALIIGGTDCEDVIRFWFFVDASPNSRDRITDRHPSEPLTKLVR